MARIRAFRGVRYNSAVVEDLHRVVSPPYDVISAEQQTLLHLRSPYNAVWLDLNRDPEPYTTAATMFHAWLDQGVLIQDQEPALYFYAQDFTVQGGDTYRRTGLLAALQLEEFASGLVRPHEQTFERAKDDRLALLRACQAHLSPVFFLYARPDWSVERLWESQLTAPPLVDVDDDQYVRHRLWRVTDQACIAEVTAGLEQESLIIADGHHRYETALQYRREQAAQGRSSRGEESLNYVLAYLTNVRETGLVILPTHRLVHNAPLPSVHNLRAVLRREFRLSLFPKTDPTAFLTALRTAGQDRRIGCALADTEHFWLLAFGEQVARTLPVSAALRAVDVTVLHDVIFQRVLGLTAELQKHMLSYTINAEEALRAVSERRCQAAFLLNAPSFEQIAQVCTGGETMPQKSTYFYPKLLTGLVFYRL